MSTQNHPKKTLRWQDGFVFALPIASGLFVGVGYMIGAIGIIPATLACFLLTVVALLQNKLFAEMAAMFPDRTGGVALFVAEAWKRYFKPIAPVAAFGYWCGWGLSLALTGITIGYLIQAQWFPDATWILFTAGEVAFVLPHVIGVATVVLCTVLNIAGVRVALRVNQAVGAVFAIVLVLLLVGPFFSGDWSTDRFASSATFEWKTFFVWLFVVAWAIYGTELCAVFAAEYKDTARDTNKALTSVALFMIGAYTLVPLATTGQLGADTVASNPITYGVLSIQAWSNGLAGFVTAALCGAVFLIMISSSADAGRALFGISAEGLSIKQLDKLDRRGVPTRALLTTMLVNVLMVAFVGNPVAILIASNIGYILSITLGISGFLLLRKDRPDLPRPIRLGKLWIPVAWILIAFNATILLVGMTNPGLSHAGGAREVIVGVGVLSIGLVLFAYRRLVQDRSSGQPSAAATRETVDERIVP